MLWLNFLHLYQPANADEKSIREAVDKSYFRLLRALEEHPDLKFTFNITGCLVERWVELGYLDLIRRIKRLIDRGQLEITGSAAYHPILPLVTEKEAILQIKENKIILKKYFGVKPKGFFFPEMAFDDRTLRLVKKMGYEWIVADEIALTPVPSPAPVARGRERGGSAAPRRGEGNVGVDVSSGLKVIFRSRKFSNGYVPDLLRPSFSSGSEASASRYEAKASKPGFEKLRIKNCELRIVTATDAELYGLRHEDPTGEFEKLIKNKNLETATFSEFIKQQKTLEKIFLRASSWESTEAELKRGEPFALWYSKKNKIQMRLWEFARFANLTLEKYSKDKNITWARWHLVRGLASCTFWWASGKDFKDIFGPVAWHPDDIERYMSELLRAIRSLEDKKTLALKIKAEKFYTDIRFLIWENHWKKYWK
jgi:alpha-amylase/alpha-mannosidase (GH57 family)